MSSADITGESSRQRFAIPLPGAVDVDLSFGISDLHALRSTLTAHASQLGVPPDLTDHLVIVASELATNVIRHGGGSGRLRLWRHDNLLYCQVSDQGPGMADPTIGSTRPDPGDTDAHRGLWICRSLTEALTVEANPDGPGVTVTARIRLPG